MSYSADKTFWQKYNHFVEESLPRHQKAINDFPTIGWGFEKKQSYARKPFNALLDLGCGQSLEAKQLFSFKKYLGVDKNPPSGSEFLSADYRNLQEIKDYLNHFKPDVFCSLFSTEITAPFSQNYEFYKELFRTVPSLKYGYVAGFYYKDKLDSLVVDEGYGITSYQSLEAQEVVKNNCFNEWRTYVNAPSALFGPNVVEVWKMLAKSK